MRSLNKVLLIGNLTKDPESIDLDSGIKMAKFTIATNKSWSNKNGEKKEQTDFHTVVAWRKLAEICNEYLKKGSAVMIEGKLHNNKFKDKEGREKNVTEVHADEVNFISYRKNQEVDEINLVSVETETV
ncbi:single-stranded DNA-binding protein [Candidatus Peregrinibacteria bacterium]|nr:single-stranded DNA-binding protein [Candidatus Peregrinibacteria bacterium]